MYCTYMCFSRTLMWINLRLRFWKQLQLSCTMFYHVLQHHLPMYLLWVPTHIRVYIFQSSMADDWDANLLCFACETLHRAYLLLWLQVLPMHQVHTCSVMCRFQDLTLQLTPLSSRMASFSYQYIGLGEAHDMAYHMPACMWYLRKFLYLLCFILFPAQLSYFHAVTCWK